MKSLLQKIFGRSRAAAEASQASEVVIATRPRQFLLTEAVLRAIADGLSDSRVMEEEKIVFLFGTVTEEVNLVAALFKPRAQTTYGSFHVSKLAMAEVVRTASRLGMEVVGQVHTHPGEAYHSGGDDDGTHIAYPGFLSVVVPNFGCDLPSLKGAAFYVCTGRGAFERIPDDQVLTISTYLEP